MQSVSILMNSLKFSTRRMTIFIANLPPSKVGRRRATVTPAMALQLHSCRKCVAVKMKSLPSAESIASCSCSWPSNNLHWARSGISLRKCGVKRMTSLYRAKISEKLSTATPLTACSMAFSMLKPTSRWPADSHFPSPRCAFLVLKCFFSQPQKA